MIKTIWSSRTAFKSGTNLPVGKLLISNDGSETGILLQVIDLATFQNIGDVASVELEILNNGTPPTNGQTVTMWSAFSSYSTKTAAQLLTAAASLVCQPGSGASTTSTFMAPLYYMGARFLYVWFDHTALAAGATLELTLNVNTKTG